MVDSLGNGKLIAIYGVNNLGKTYQAKRLADFLREIKGLSVEYLKYPLYDLDPTGSLINNYLREGNSHDLTNREFQIIQVLNRTQFDKELREKIKNGVYVVVEDYIGTGIAWGVGSGADEELLVSLNSHLLKEDAAILLDGERFSDAKESGHLHEEDDVFTSHVREIHLQLANDFDWCKINANQSRDEVFSNILSVVEKEI